MRDPKDVRLVEPGEQPPDSWAFVPEPTTHTRSVRDYLILIIIMPAIGLVWGTYLVLQRDEEDRRFGVEMIAVSVVLVIIISVILSLFGQS